MSKTDKNKNIQSGSANFSRVDQSDNGSERSGLVRSDGIGDVYIPFVRKDPHSPVTEYKTIIKDSGDPGYVNRILIATPTTGLVRYEWSAARWGQITPTNWSAVQMAYYMGGYAPIRYQVADAQNMIVKHLLEHDFEWLFLIEHDVVLPPDAFIKLNYYMTAARFPIVSGLCYTRTRNPCEPMIYRGRGTGSFYEWEPGDLVYCDGLPTGVLLIHAGILRLMWEDSEDYEIPYGAKEHTRKIFNTPRRTWIDPETGQVNTTSGTSDLEWCTRVIEHDYIKRAGWGSYWENLEDKRYPLIVDTSIFCRHVEKTGEMFP